MAVRLAYFMQESLCGQKVVRWTALENEFEM